MCILIIKWCLQFPIFLFSLHHYNIAMLMKYNREKFVSYQYFILKFIAMKNLSALQELEFN